MRGARWLLLAAIAAIIGAVGYTYKAQLKVLQGQSRAKPRALAPELNFTAENYHFRKTGSDNRLLVDIAAQGFQQGKDSARVELTGLELKLYHKDGNAFDLVKGPAATFFSNDNRLYSEGEV